MISLIERHLVIALSIFLLPSTALIATDIVTEVVVNAETDALGDQGNIIAKSDSIDASTALNPSIPEPQTIPGNFIELSIPKTDALAPEAYFGQHSLVLLDEITHWRALVGVDLETIPGRYVITYTNPDKSNAHLAFTVKPFQYQLTTEVDNSLGNRFIKRFLTRNKKHTPSFKLPKLPWSNLSPKLPFRYPAKGLWTKQFGHVYQKNREQLLQTNYIQLTTTEAQPVIAPSDAICLQIEESDGKYSVWLDHGMGLFSHISGLRNISIEEQDRVQKGSVISNITDNTNSSTVPTQVSWRVVLNNALINPHSLAIAAKKKP